MRKQLTGRFSQVGFRLAMLAMLTIHRTVRQKPSFWLFMAEAFTWLLRSFGMAHKTRQLYQNSLIL